MTVTTPGTSARDRAAAALARMPTTTMHNAPSVRAQAVFGRPPTGIALPLNRKTTQQAIQPMPLEGLEPRQELVPVGGLAAYIARPRRDPPDVARVQMRDGRERLLVQEGHTRLGAAVLRGEAEMPMRVWEFVQTDAGDFAPVVRGRQRIYERIRDRPYSAKVQALSGQVVNLPDVRDVSFPSLVGASRPRKKRKPVKFKGVKLSRAPMQFEITVLSLAEIPPRLDAAVTTLQHGDMPLRDTLSDVARFGVRQALLELVRQGAPDTILLTPPDCEDAVRQLAVQVQAARTADFATSLHLATESVGRRRIPARRRIDLIHELTARFTPGILTRHAKRAVNMAFALGRATVIEHYRRPRVDLASKFDQLESGAIWVDAVIHTAVMDTNTCEECEAVDGEVMELGDDRQEELHPPYVKCLGGDRCRCVQIALLSDGSEIDVDEVPDTAYPDDDTDEEDDF